jgi:transposase
MAMDTQATLPPQLWDQTPPEVQVYIRALEVRLENLEALEAKVRMLQEQVRTLEEQLKQTSRNSSRPPSSDPPHAQRPKRPRSGRRRGGQLGHRGQTRTLIPVEDVNEVASEGQPWCRLNPSSVPAATLSYRERIRRRFAIK